MELIEQLKNDGIAKGLCRQWQMKLKSDLQICDLAKLYIQGIDFCINKNYPTIDFIRNNFKGKCEPYGIYVDDTVNTLNKPDTVLNGCCNANLIYSGFSVSRVYARHNSKLLVKVMNYAHVTIDLFDETSLNLVSIGSKARVLVNVYGNAKITSFGNGIKVIHKNRNTY